ncbi:bile acid cotransporter [Podarcis lilfordi]|uniref:Bile acid cotransporter n=1 Tax=Podarcis lilfordi TaxID=74358 RepID=A0AA35JPP1_9SAUR|nr:bile acid cotransporter [Podarcis lilfordi]
MEISKIMGYLRKPKEVAVAVVAQYGIMPLTAFALGKLFQLEPTEALAVLICGCCPGAGGQSAWRPVCPNVQQCSTILKMAFASEVIGPLFIFPSLYLIFQLGEGLLLVVIFRSYDKIKETNDSAKMIYRNVGNSEVETNQ